MLVTKMGQLVYPLQNQYLHDVGYRLALNNFESVVSTYTPYSQLRVVDEVTYETLLSFNKHYISSFEFLLTHYENNRLESCDFEGTLRVYDENAQQIVTEYEEPDKLICSIDFSHIEESMLLSGSDNSKVKIWCTKQQTSAINIHVNTNISSVKYIPESSTYIKVGSVDHNIYYYDLRNTSRPLSIVSDQQETAATDDIVCLWDIYQYHPVSTFVGVSRDIQEIPTDSESEALADFGGNLDGSEIGASPDSFVTQSSRSSPWSSVSGIDSSLDSDIDTLDFQGYPADKSTTGGWPAAACILGVELAQRFCMVGVSTNLVTFMRGPLHISSSESANMMTTCIGFINILAIFGGFLADVKFGRYKSIVLSALISVIGLVSVSVQAFTYRGHHGIANLEKWILFVSFYTFAIGVAGIKANASGFGSDQFDESNPQALKAEARFFHMFYLCVDVGSLFAITVLYYIQEKFGNYAYGIGICTGMMSLALVLLLCGQKSYRYKKPQQSALTILWRVMFGAWRNRKISYPEHPSFLSGYKKYRWLEKATISKNEDRMFASISQVEDIKEIMKLIPISMTCCLFWTIHTQMDTFTIEQAAFMNCNYGRLTIPASSFSVFLYFSTLLCSYLYEHVYVRMVETRDRRRLTSLQKVGIGLVFSIMGMVVAAVCEKKRRTWNDGAKLSAFWLVPQLFLLGAGEAFSYGQFEFFITQVPERMKSLATGLFLSTMAMGYFVSTLVVSTTNIATNRNWIKSDLNQGKLENFYWMLAALGAFNLLAFLYVSFRHHYRTNQRDATNNCSEIEFRNTNIDNV